jgi:heme/copper-type cytochrome/quinol oxidase subunit 2
MIVSGGSLALLIFTAGIVGPITIIASIVGTVLGHKGRDDHRQGKTTQGHDEAVAGFWMGIAGIVLSILAVIAWVAVILFAVYYDDSNSVHTFHHGFELPPELQQ